MQDWPERERYTAEDLLQIIRILRDRENGCPWDKVQTHASIRKNFLEETCEALEAIDADVIKTYVRLGLGIGIVAEMAMRDDPLGDLVVRPVGHLFGQSVARVAFKRGAYLRNFVYKFAELLSDRLSRELIARAMTGHVNDYEF